MKTQVASLLVGLFLITTQSMAQRTIRVEAQSNDISNNLDLQAVASIFGDSRDLEEFERRLNDYDSQISNLDLNFDGEVDYLRVIESSEKKVHVVVIQAVLDRDIFQDVATIVVDRKSRNRTYVQVIGDPYLYGRDYIIEPVYVYTPSIFSFFWSRHYYTWHSPYYWGYYPTYYRYRRPYEVNIYLTNVRTYVNYNHSYYYTDARRNVQAERLHSSIRRNDYATRYPNRSFTSRNENVRNKYEINPSNSLQRRTMQNESGRRGAENREAPGVNRNPRNVSPTWNGGSSTDRRGVNSPTERRNTDQRRNTEMNRSNSNERNVSPSRDSRSVEMNRNNSTERNVNPSRENRSTEMNRGNTNERNVSPSRPVRNMDTERSYPSQQQRTVTPQNRNDNAPVITSPPRTNPNTERNNRQVEPPRQAPTRNNESESRNKVTRESRENSAPRQAPSVQQAPRSEPRQAPSVQQAPRSEPRQVERSQPENNRSNSRQDNDSRSTPRESNRR